MTSQLRRLEPGKFSEGLWSTFSSSCSLPQKRAPGVRQLWPVEPLPGPVSPQQVPGGADDREAGGPARPRGHGPRHPHQLVRKLQRRMFESCCAQESMARREARWRNVFCHF